MALPNLQELIDYYVNLLIIQYHNKPKAQETIELFVRELLADDIFFQIQDGYNLRTNAEVWSDDTLVVWDDNTLKLWSDTGGATIILAVGKQLDVLAKYVGIDRYYRDLGLINFFGLATYSEDDPDADEKFGFTDYADFDDDDLNGTLTYHTVISVNNRLVDDAFIQLIFLKILQNTSNYSHASIDDGIWMLYGPAVRPESPGDMLMTYFVSSFEPPSIPAAIAKKLLPRPMGVGMVVVTGVTGDMFGFALYDEEEPTFAYGFTDFDDYDALPGQIAIYDQIERG